MQILIIEDETLAADKLKTVIKELDTNCEILDVIKSVDAAIEWLNKNDQPDLILSDIHLADGICFNIYTQVSISCPIIFVTAYEKYAIQAFEVNSIDYLLKPVTKDRLKQSLVKYDSLKSKSAEDRSQMFDEFKKLLGNTQKDYKQRFLCKLGNKIKSIPTTSIKYFYSKDKMTFLVDSEGNRLPVNNTLDEIDQMIDPYKFFRLNRQVITHFDSIDEIHPYFKGRLKLMLAPKLDGDIIVSTERTPLFKSWLDR